VGCFRKKALSESIDFGREIGLTGCLVSGTGVAVTHNDEARLVNSVLL
jgi:hypothetical protein